MSKCCAKPLTYTGLDGGGCRGGGGGGRDDDEYSDVAQVAAAARAGDLCDLCSLCTKPCGSSTEVNVWRFGRV